MKILRTVAVAAGLTASTIALPSAQAQSQDAYQQYFQKFVEYQCALMARKDLDGYWKTVTPDHFHINIKGARRNLKQQRQTLAEMTKYLRAWDYKVKVGNVRVNGSTATATVASGQTITLWHPQLNRDIHIQAQGVEEYTFRRVNGKWLESSSRETKTKVWLEGKEVPDTLLGRSK